MTIREAALTLRPFARLLKPKPLDMCIDCVEDDWSLAGAVLDFGRGERFPLCWNHVKAAARRLRESVS